jgi:hypothetical protein
MQVDIYNSAHIINQPQRLQFSIVSTKHAQRIKCGIGLNTIILQYYTMPNMKNNLDFVWQYLYIREKFKYFLIYYFQRKNNNAMGRIPFIAQNSWIQTLS